MVAPVHACTAFLLTAMYISGQVRGAVWLNLTALFVFGDSYADTGNHDRHSSQLYIPWRPPYGHTWPGSAAGRFSDGKILTDYIASFLNIPSPLPYREIGFHPERIDWGINFAFGGSGVFFTFGYEYPTVGTQISQFYKLVENGTYSRRLLANSVALVVVAGNDYTVYLQKHPGSEGITSFIPKVVDKIKAHLENLYKVGIRRFVVTNLEPAGCLPAVTYSNNYGECNRTQNNLSLFHNELLRDRISYLVKQLPEAHISTLDQYNAFLAVLSNVSGDGGHKNPLEPCCRGTGNSTCGSVDSLGRPLYTLCSTPEEAFFWDDEHPTQAGWKAVSEKHRSLIEQSF